MINDDNDIIEIFAITDKCPNFTGFGHSEYSEIIRVFNFVQVLPYFFAKD